MTAANQANEMATYANTYGDFTIVDGTHNMLMYDLKLIPYTNVDCLGKNVVSGYCLDESENGESIKEGLQLFGLANAKATLMSDGGSAYATCAQDNRHDPHLVHTAFPTDNFHILWRHG